MQWQYTSADTARSPMKKATEITSFYSLDMTCLVSNLLATAEEQGK